MVLHAFYAAWDEAVKAGAKPSEGQYRKMIEQEEKAKHKALNGGKVQLDAMLKELNGDKKLDDEQAKKLEEILAVLGEEAIEESKHHHHHHSGPMPLLSTPNIVQTWEDKEYPEVHIGWADIYLDLILVGVAFNGGLMLKHAFYLCHPHDAAHGAAEHHRSMFERVETHSHPTCVGLGMGVLHVLAFGVPILGAWLKETMFRARFEAHNLVARSLEVMCYLLMIIGASCEEDVTILQEDRTFWQMFTTCMLVIDLTWVGRYMQVAYWHPDPVARLAGKQRLFLLSPGTLLFLLAYFLGNYPDQGDAFLAAVLGNHAKSEHTHLFYVPISLILGANTPIIAEMFAYMATKYKPALPMNTAFVLHRCTEIFMVLLGESVLQLITSEMPTKDNYPGMSMEQEQAIHEKFSGMQIAGFILTLTVMHSFTIQEPEEHDKHVLAVTGGAKGTFWLLVFIMKSLAVWLVGIGIKIALYDPMAQGDAFFSHDQRLQLGSSCALCFFFSGIMLPLHKETICTHFVEIFGNPVSAIGFIAWMGNVVMMYRATYWELPPYEYMWVQAGLGVVHMVISHLELLWIPHFLGQKQEKARQARKAAAAARKAEAERAAGIHTLA